jgi:hypothetical protein
VPNFLVGFSAPYALAPAPVVARATMALLLWQQRDVRPRHGKTAQTGKCEVYIKEMISLY